MNEKMKKLFCAVFNFLFVTTVYAAARPSLDGRATVAEPGVLPSGLFARTVGYLPGDSLSVSNTANGKTIDILVLGTIDPSEGVAILLAPEAAAALGIAKNSNVIVKLTKRIGTLDEESSGSAVLSDAASSPKTDESPETNPPSAEEKSAPEKLEDVPAESAADENLSEPVPASEENAENDGKIEPEKLEDVPAENAADEKLTEPIPTPEENAGSDEKIAPEKLEDVPEESAVDEKHDEPVPASEENAENDEKIAPEKLENVPAESAADEKLDEPVPASEENAENDEKIAPEKLENVPEESAVDEKLAEPVPASEETAENDGKIAPEKLEDVPAESAEDEKFDEPVPTPEETAETDEKIAPEESGEDEKLSEPVPAPAKNMESGSDVASDDVPSPAKKTEPLAEDSRDEQVYQPIVLIPAEMNPPKNSASDEKIPEETVEEPAAGSRAAKTAQEGKRYKIPEEIVSEPSAAEAKSPSKAKHKIPEEIVSENSVAGKAPKKYDIPEEVVDENPSVSPSAGSGEPISALVRSKIVEKERLEKGTYVQVAILGSVKNLNAAVSKIPEKYRVCVVPSGTGDSAYTVLVGPVPKKSGKSVQKEMRAAGFKDAFIKNVK